ncbi:MAG: 2TM domain-containing protein [Caulobacteraceae bacterium]|nr:2TM domain-containing protein [Caulobacteraceae bacterium]
MSRPSDGLCPGERRAPRAQPRTSPRVLWFYWPLLGWGIGLGAHAIDVYGYGGAGRETAVQREMERLREERERR